MGWYKSLRRPNSYAQIKIELNYYTIHFRIRFDKRKKQVQTQSYSY